MRTSFCAPSPSRTTASARSISTASNARAKSRSMAPPSAGTRGCRVSPVAISSTVSDVEVSESTVVQLNDRSTPCFSSFCNTAAGIFASVNTKHSIVAMSGAIMPLPLAMPVIRTSCPPISAVLARCLREGIGGHDAAGGSLPPVLAQRIGSAGSAATSFSCGSTSPITPVEATNTCRAGSPPGPPLPRPWPRRPAPSRQAGEHVGVAGIHHHQPRLAALQRAAAPIHRRARALVGGEHAGHRAARRDSIITTSVRPW